MKLMKFKTKENVATAITLILITILILIPNAFEKNMYPNAEKAKAKIISVNNDQVKVNGIIRYGENFVK